MANYSWIPESEAAKKINRKPRTLRELVKAGKLQVAYTTINGRTYQYSERDINRMLDSNASIN
jgi:predicted DNA-binding protein (UPF0251 family)